MNYTDPVFVRAEKSLEHVLFNKVKNEMGKLNDGSYVFRLSRLVMMIKIELRITIIWVLIYGGRKMNQWSSIIFSNNAWKKLLLRPRINRYNLIWQ